MPIVNGKYEAKIATVFAAPEQAVKQIKSKIKKSRKVRINNIPAALLEDLAPLLAEKDVRIILPEKQKTFPMLSKLGPVAVAKSKIYKDYKGKEALVGSVSFSDRIFNITWANNKILEIDAMEYDKCVKCMKDMFETAWRYSAKQ